MKLSFDYDTLDDSHFSKIAETLFHNYQLIINKKKFRLAEIEFYLNSKNHPDTYTHNDLDQLLNNCFYFHKFKTGTYKAGTFKGMDITFGNAESKSYFGILVRAIIDLETNEIVEGPCKVVNKILELYGCDSIMDFTTGNNLNIFKNNHKFILQKVKLSAQEMYHGPRIGLSTKYPDYQNSNYRFVIHKEKIKKKKTSLIKI